MYNLALFLCSYSLLENIHMQLQNHRPSPNLYNISLIFTFIRKNNTECSGLRVRLHYNDELKTEKCFSRTDDNVIKMIPFTQIPKKRLKTLYY